MTIDIFLNRELWWLEGNRPFLEAAQDPAAPLLERLKSLAVISTNLDEFFTGRMPVLKQRIREIGQTATTPNARSRRAARPWSFGLPAALAVRAVAKRVNELTSAQQSCFLREIQPLLARDGIRLVHPTDISGIQRHRLDEYFHRTVFPILTPLTVGPGHPFPILRNLCPYLLISLRPSTPSTLPHSEICLIPIPRQVLPRFIALPDPRGRRVLMLLEDIIRLYLPTICNGYRIVSSHAIRVTRAASRPTLVRLGDRVTSTREILRTGPRYQAVRLQLDADVPDNTVLLLRRELGLCDDDVYPGVGFVAWPDLFRLYRVLRGSSSPKPLPFRQPTPARLRAIEAFRPLALRP
jgi:polyphosphate kinase